MSKQTMVYDSDGGGFVGTFHPQFNVEENRPVLIRAAGLEEEVPILQMVGICSHCDPDDVLWEPVYVCGVPLMIGPQNNQTWVLVPGKYSLGDPVNPVTLTGDVNITKQEYSGLNPEYMGQVCGGTPTGATVEVNFPECPDTGTLGVITDLNLLN